MGGLRSAALDAVVEARAPYKPDAALSAARSFADRAPVDAAVERELTASQFVQMEPMAVHSRLLEEPQEHSPLAVPHAGLPEWQEQSAVPQLSLGSLVWAALPELVDAASQQLATLALELPALRPGAQPALLLEPAEALRDAAEQDAESEQLPAAAFR